MKQYRNESGKYHRLDGPAVEDSGYKSWWINGLRHREDGPAIEYRDGSKAWYLNDIEYSEEEYTLRLKLERLKNLK